MKVESIRATKEVVFENQTFGDLGTDMDAAILKLLEHARNANKQVEYRGSRGNIRPVYFSLNEESDGNIFGEFQFVHTYYEDTTKGDKVNGT